MKTAHAVLLALGLGLGVSVADAGEGQWRPTTSFLHAVCQVESGGGKFLRGDGGRSLGDFQIGKGAWADVNQWRKSRNQPTYEYRRNVFNKKLNRLYAADYLTILHDQLVEALRREPTAGEIYAAYNMGLSNFSSCNYRLAKVNATTAKKCQQIELFLQSRLKG